MKKNFLLTAPNKRPDRHVEAIKHDLNKYVARERRKTLPEGSDFWDFDCKFGAEATQASSIPFKEISKKIDEAVSAGAASVYVEILARAASRPRQDQSEDESQD